MIEYNYCLTTHCGSFYVQSFSLICASFLLLCLHAVYFLFYIYFFFINVHFVIFCISYLSLHHTYAFFTFLNLWHIFILFKYLQMSLFYEEILWGIFSSFIDWMPDMNFMLLNASLCCISLSSVGLCSGRDFFFFLLSYNWHTVLY